MLGIADFSLGTMNISMQQKVSFYLCVWDIAVVGVLKHSYGIKMFSYIVLKCVKCSKSSSMSREDLFLTFLEKIKTCNVRVVLFLLPLLLLLNAAQEFMP